MSKPKRMHSLGWNATPGEIGKLGSEWECHAANLEKKLAVASQWQTVARTLGEASEAFGEACLVVSVPSTPEKRSKYEKAHRLKNIALSDLAKLDEK